MSLLSNDQEFIVHAIYIHSSDGIVSLSCPTELLMLLPYLELLFLDWTVRQFKLTLVVNNYCSATLTTILCNYVAAV